MKNYRDHHSFPSRVLRGVRENPVDATVAIVGGPWLIKLMVQGVYRQLTTIREENPKFSARSRSIRPDVTEEGDENLVRLHGKAFRQVETENQVDLSWSGALPYYLPVVVLGMEAGRLLLHGIRPGKVSPAARQAAAFHIFFSVLPLVDMLCGDDWDNPSKSQQKNRRLAKTFRAPLYLWVLVEFMLTVGTFKAILDPKAKLSRRDRIGLVLTMGVVGGLGINVSHELLHKNDKLERFLAYLLLVNVNYCHWEEEHRTGHHVRVATPDDPATSRENESLYAFFPRTVLGTWKSSCEIEQKRLLKEHGVTSWYTPHNRVIRGTIASFIWSLVLARLTRSMLAIPLFYTQAAIGAFLLESVNYIEHYGLLRKKDPATGEYEPVDPRHSFNAPNYFSNVVLFKLQRHSDHHTFPQRPYEILRNFAESPQMPTGYIGMVVLAMFPQAFFYVMNPLVKAHRLENDEEQKTPSDGEVNQIRELKLTANRRMWGFSLGFLGVATKVLYSAV